MTFDPIKRREQLRGQLAKVLADHAAAGKRREAIRGEEGIASNGSPMASTKALERARVDAARGEVDAAEVERLEHRKREVEEKLAGLLGCQRLAMQAKKVIQEEIADLHRQQFAAFAEVAEKKVAEVERIGEELLPLLGHYVTAWAEAVEAWREPCRDNGLVGAPAPLLPRPEQLRGKLPRPPQVEPVEEAA